MIQSIQLYPITWKMSIRIFKLQLLELLWNKTWTCSCSWNHIKSCVIFDWKKRAMKILYGISWIYRCLWKTNHWTSWSSLQAIFLRYEIVKKHCTCICNSLRKTLNLYTKVSDEYQNNDTSFQNWIIYHFSLWKL